MGRQQLSMLSGDAGKVGPVPCAASGWKAMAIPLAILRAACTHLAPAGREVSRWRGRAQEKLKEFLEETKKIGKVRLITTNDAAVMEAICTTDKLFYAEGGPMKKARHRPRDSLPPCARRPGTEPRLPHSFRSAPAGPALRGAGRAKAWRSTAQEYANIIDPSINLVPPRPASLTRTLADIS